MIRKIKVLGLAAFAVLAVSAIGASAAHATKFTASGYPTTATGESAKGNDVFTTEAGNVECHSHFETTLTAASETATVKAKYTECRAFGFLSATVDMRSCDYVFHTSGAVDMACSSPLKEPIEIVASTCTATVSSQNTGGTPINQGLTKVTLANGVGDITAKAAVKGIILDVTNDGFACPFSGKGEKTSGNEYNQGTAVTMKSISGTTIDIG